MLGWPALRYPPANAIIGGLMILAGWLLGLWTNYVQFTLGRGTPVPVMATQKLIISSPVLVLPQPDGPGRHRGLPGRERGRRVAGRRAAGGPGAVVLLTYIRLVEEKEMVARFGEAYLAYRRRVPFIIPRLHKGS